MSVCFKAWIVNVRAIFRFFFSHCRSQPQNSDVCTARTINKDSLHIHALGVQCSACHSLFYFFLLLLVFRKSVDAAVTRQHTQTPSVLVLASPSKPDPPFSNFTSPSSGLSLNSSNKAGLRSSLDHAKTERTSSGTSRGSRLRRYVTGQTFCFFSTRHGKVSRRRSSSRTIISFCTHRLLFL